MAVKFGHVPVKGKQRRVTKNISVRVDGVEIDKALAQINVDLRDRVAKKALRKAAGVVRTEMRRLAPKDTGELRNSIKAAVRDYGHLTLAFVGPADVDKRQATKNNTLEYGSDSRGIRPIGFVRGAADNTKDQLEGVIIKAIQDEIGK